MADMGNSATFPPSREVKTNYGAIVGRRLIHEGEKQVDAFQGIPYAKPPVGELRFKNPVPHEPWTGVKETKAFGPRSIQVDRDASVKEKLGPTSEDCLTLNVFTPVWKPENEKGFAVMVFIHGGAYVQDSAVKYGDINICQHLVTKDVVVVTIQYRLGYLGEWSTGDDVCPGNMNLWDQTLAVKWVKENISHFNGDSDNITLFGQSAGGASVDLLSLSPHSRDLFHKVIPMAGNASCNWAASYQNVETCRAAAEKFGVTCSEDSEKFLNELRKLPADTFALSMYHNGGTSEPPAEPVLGPRIDGIFLPKDLCELRKEAPLKPRMVGLCHYEGLMFMILGDGKPTDVNKTAAKLFPERLFPKNFKKLRDDYVKMILDPAVEDQQQIQREIAQAHGDWFLNVGAQQCVKDCVELGDEPVYLYRFDHFNPQQFGPMGAVLPFIDSTHCNDISYVVGVGVAGSFDFDEKDMKVVDLMATLFTNFAKYGDPNGQSPPAGVKWLPVTKETPQNHLQISLDSKMSDKFYDGRPLWCLEQMEK